MIKTEKGENVIAIENESIRMAKSDCSDHVCEQFGARSKPGQTIVCLPHQIYVEVRGNKVDSEETIDSGAY
ncbi:NusG domain II-containing protein [Cellulosilyticum ruminicola]|uniref:NusG domain II-containing protein n=1 Tax=Cellulosilyticum ruminicola TaxID=425254 RepID=UPI0006CFABAA|nr:NusG domain II-containing protein [Cellulosilyticum ruminicola]